MSKIKVVHICTSRSGGAGGAAYRIHTVLLKNGIDSSFLTIEDFEENCSKDFSYYDKLPENFRTPNFIERQKNRIRFRIRKHLKIVIKSTTDKEREEKIKNQEERKAVFSKFSSISKSLKCEIATLPFSPYDILQNPIVKEADIIHLHWVANVLDYCSFFNANEKPVVWTLHDMNPFKGLFHYNDDERENVEITSGLNELVNSIKSRSINKRKCKLRIVSPSYWLLKELRNSRVFKKIKALSIPYPIDTLLFYNQLNKTFRKQNEIPENNKIFLFVSENIHNYRKGFDLLIDAFKKLANPTFTLLILGAGDDSIIIKGIDVRNIGTINNQKKLVDYFSSADAFIIPSREDNLPNVMLESLACGTPIIGFPVGGIKEHVINFKTGLLADDISSDSLAIAIEKFCKTEELFKRDVIRQYAEEKFNEELIAGEYVKIYKQLSKKSR